MHVAGGRSKAEELFDKADPASVPYRTTVCRAGSGYYVLMANEIVDPPTSDGGVDHGVQELIVTIYSPGEITMTQRTEDPKTAKREFIKRGDASFYSASGYKTRRYKGSSKPIDIPSFVWQAMSVKERRKAIEEEQKGLAAKAKAKARPKATPAMRLGNTGRTSKHASSRASPTRRRGTSARLDHSGSLSAQRDVPRPLARHQRARGLEVVLLFSDDVIDRRQQA